MPVLSNKIFKSLVLLLLFSSLKSFSQEKTKKHKILKGETITSIAKDNKVSLQEIYDLNPNAKKILKLNSVLLIPISIDKKAKRNKKPSKKEIEVFIEKTHTVLPKETLYSISKKYKISIENLKKWNPIIENSGLAIDQVINVVENKQTTHLENENENSNIQSIIHEVLAKETKYSISKKYKISIQKLEELNPEIIENLPMGFKLIVSQSNDSNLNPNVAIENTIPKTDTEIATPREIEVGIFQPNDSIAIARPITNLDLANSLEQRATDNIGTRYHSGGTKPGGFDCSGLMIYTFENSGVKLPRTSAAQSNFGTRINKQEAQKGDLIFFSTRGSSRINHVGMVVENKDGEIKFIHSSSSSGVIISTLSEHYYQRAFRKINRVLD